MSAATPMENNGPLIYIPVAVFLVACPLLVAIRFWSRVRNGGYAGADDYTILAALVCSLISDGLMIAACVYGYGHHVNDLSHENHMQSLKYFWLDQIAYKACLNLTKASILLLYLRIFGNVKWFRWLCTVLTAIVATYCAISVTVTIFQCTPVTRVYDKTVAGRCIDNSKFWFANAGFSIATDLVILFMPLPMVYVLQLPRVQKAALMAVFTLGAFVVITSCLRITTINQQATTYDPTYDIASTMWTVIEMNVAIVCACLSQIRPVIMMLFPKLMPASYSRDRSAKAPNNNSLAKLSSSPAKSVSSHWMVSGRHDDIALGAMRQMEGSSDEHILPEDRTMHIQKTVRYSVEYSRDEMNLV
ncbi:hypothetical protein PG999_007448 [Apiospora kogelbergensis]|uniref:Rhodopsin domain-containing protein n=1 Tax=Apiospora kogelbergensis TaxID=1337665 RepID=A0AAW0QYA9_9PEZI